ncbi:MAG: translation initiation factor IF-2 [Planctomycetota bacterium]
MGGDKVKVFTLAKRYGFKSAKFVHVLRDIGFPVTSYQASIDAWDVPVIESRLLRGGLIDPSLATESDTASGGGEGKAKSVGWNVVVEQAPPASGTTPAPAAENQEEERHEAAPAPEEALEAEAGPEVSGAEPLSPEASPAPPEPEPETPAAAASEVPAAAEAPATAAPEGTAAPQASGPVAAPPGGAKTAPKPRPSGSAKRLGKIDLAALNRVKARQKEKRKNVTFTDVRDRESARRRDERSKQREKMRSRRQGTMAPKGISTVKRKGDIVLDPPVTVKSFSSGTGISVNKIIGRLMRLGTMTGINAMLDEDTVQILAEEFNVGIRVKSREDIEDSLMEEIQEARKGGEESELSPRPPVIAFLGHVDHGKTSLIDAIRHTDVARGEAGGITQHIGAYQVEIPGGKKITILDTPGHEAFTAMRARGARTTDIVILVVAADDGVMPQTEEAANHAKEAGVPIIIALNKVDKPNANPDRVKTQLAQMDLQPEDWGGKVAVIPVSAIQQTGLQDLLDRVILEAEVLELRARPSGQASGTVLESMISEGKGKVAHTLVQDGCLKVGDIVLAGQAYGSVRLMHDHLGLPLRQASPSTPVEVLGMNDLPKAGERFFVVPSLAAAKGVAEKRLFQIRQAERAERAKVSLENLFAKMEQGALKRIRLVVKADVQGSLEVLRASLNDLSNEEVTVELVHSAVGGVTESDVLLAETAEAVVIGFHVVADEMARAAAEKSGVEIRRYDVIYELLEDIQKAMEGLLAPENLEEITAHIEVREIFRSSRFGNIAGCFVLDGEVSRTDKARLTREGRVIYEGEIASLRRLKDDARKVRAGLECGIKIRNYEDIKVGDVIETFRMIQKRRTLESLHSR